MTAGPALSSPLFLSLVFFLGYWAFQLILYWIAWQLTKKRLQAEYYRLRLKDSGLSNDVLTDLRMPLKSSNGKNTRRNY